MKKLVIYSICMFWLLPFTLKADDYQKVICPVCNGYGYVWSGYVDYYGNPIPTTCYNCGGTGYMLVPCSNSPSFQGNQYKYLATVSLYGYAVNSNKYYFYGNYDLYSNSGKYYIKSNRENYNPVYTVSVSDIHHKNFKYWCGGGGGIYYYFNYK